MSKPSGWLAFGIIAVVGVVVASCAISSTSASPREYIGKSYDCDADPTEVDRATCGASGSPSSVASDISADTSPVDQGRAADDVSTYDCDNEYSTTDDELCNEADKPYEDQTVYMQYEDDIVVVSDDGSGCTVDVYDYDEGYRSHGAFFAAFGWSSSRPSSSRGGFGGFGK